MRPAGEGFPVQVFWDEHTRTFSGFDHMNGKTLEIATDQIVEMLENPECQAQYWLFQLGCTDP